jgi:DNA polymerase I-like protein with 3'-5' exonuclease and polymerase domains
MTDSNKTSKPGNVKKEDIKKISEQIKKGEGFNKEFIDQVKNYRKDVKKELDKLNKATNKDRKLLADLEDHDAHVISVITNLETNGLKNIAKEFGKTEAALKEGVSTLRNQLESTKSGSFNLNSFKPIKDTFNSLFPKKK